MKITMRTVSDVFANGKPVNNKQPDLKKPEKTDKITISAQEQRTDAQFIDALRTQIANEIRAGAGADKLNDLMRQITAGRYDINPADLAHKMLFV